MKQLAIVGTGTESRENAPFEDETFDIWTMNEAPQSEWCKRWNVLFQLHPPEIYTGFNTKRANHWEWLQEAHGKPIYMQARDERVPDSLAYPLDDAIALVGLRYLTATVCYMLALAILQGYKRIDLYGIEMSMSEYQYQAECYRFWIGFAKGCGVDVRLCSGTKLFDTLLYGYEGNFAFGAEYFTKRAAELDTQWSMRESNAKANGKSLERNVKFSNYDQAGDNIRAFHEGLYALGEIAGAMSEAERYAAFGERFTDRGGFEFAAAKAQQDGRASEIEMYMRIGEIRYVWNVWRQTKSAQAAAQMMKLVGLLGKKAEETGAFMGVYKENIGYITKYDAHAKAIGITQAG